jgi:hypothetical protein
MTSLFSRNWRYPVLAVLLTMAGAATFDRAHSADMPAPPPPSHDAAAAMSALQYLDLRADLLLIRAMFNVVAEEDIVPILETDARRLGSGAPSEIEVTALEDQLLTEGSYFLVSLSYTVQAGGAVWPTDRAEAVYEKDTIVQLATLRDRFLDAMEQSADPLPVLRQLDAINALTNGLRTLPAELDHFGKRDEVVQEAMSRASPRVNL